MTAAVVIPFASEDPRRRELLEIVTAWWENRGLRVVVGRTDPLGQWSKARAIQRGVDLADDADILIVADADVIPDPVPVKDALVNLGSGLLHGIQTWRWAMPTTTVIRLTEDGTDLWLDHGGLDYRNIRSHWVQRRYRQHPGGGLVILTRALWDEVPMDPRFIGWGQEDDAWGRALYTLADPPWRGAGHLVHLWHEPTVPEGTVHGRPESLSLYQTYEMHGADRSGMRTLVGQARELL